MVFCSIHFAAPQNLANGRLPRVGVAGRLNVMRREGTIDFVRRRIPVRRPKLLAPPKTASHERRRLDCFHEVSKLRQAR